MTTTQHEPEQVEAYPEHFEPPHGPAWRLVFGPGLVRGAWVAGLFFVLGMLLVAGLRFWWGWDPVWLWDVIHSFWVPNFGQKQDAVPGIETTILVTPKRTGEFAVICAELCGLGHATMRAKARVVTQSEFDAWVKEQAG